MTFRSNFAPLRQKKADRMLGVRMRLSIASDAISADFETAVLLGLEWGIEYFELKRIHHKRIPDVTEDEIRIVQNVLKSNAATLSSLAPGLFKVPLEGPRVEQELGPKFDKILALADSLATRSIVIFGFERDDRRTEAEALRQVIDLLGRAAARAEREGAVLFLENDRNMWAEFPESLRRVASGVNSPALRLNWDPCNLIGAHPEKPYPTGYDLVKDFVGHMHVKDATVAAGGGHAHAMMGSGDVDWVGQFERLYRDGYKGFCVIEPHFGSRVESSRSHILGTRKAMRLARARLQSPHS
jgi:L-ribulose-5-phosphate 3-epimerase